MEYCEKGNLMDRLAQGLDLKVCSPIAMAKDFARAMQYLHNKERPVLHRDLKSLNVLITGNWRCKVADFGEADVIANSKASASIRGTVCYMSPELIERKPITVKSDVYSFGIILWEVTTWHEPMYVRSEAKHSVSSRQSQRFVKRSQSDVEMPYDREENMAVGSDVGDEKKGLNRPLLETAEPFHRSRTELATKVRSLKTDFFGSLALEYAPNDSVAWAYENVVTRNKRPPIPPSVPLPLRELIEACWDYNPDNRPTFNEMITRLERLEAEIDNLNFPFR